MTAYYQQFVRTFSNVLFAVCLLLVWGLFTLIGVIVDQGKDASDYFTMYPAALARLILRLNADNIYHTPYYVGIIGLILVSLAVCTFKRVIPARLPALRPVTIDKIPLSASIDVPGDEGNARALLERFLRSRGWQIRKREFADTEWTFADRFNWARRGVLVAHIGFVIIAAGTTIYWARGFAGETPLLVGQSIDVPHSRSTLHLNAFHYKVQPIMTKSGMVYQPTDYVSDVTIAQPDGSTRNATIRVNHPLDVNGTLFYQNSYGFGVQFAVTHDGTRDSALSDRTYLLGDAITLPGSGRQIAYAQFIPTIDRKMGAPSADPRVNDPGVALEVVQDGQAQPAALVPLGTWVDAGNGWRITPQRYVMVSGLQYRYDPGVAVVGVGAFVLLAGLVISFYFLPARLYATVRQKGAGTTIAIAATTVKGYDMFEHQFGELVTALRGST